MWRSPFTSEDGLRRAREAVGTIAETAAGIVGVVVQAVILFAVVAVAWVSCNPFDPSHNPDWTPPDPGSDYLPPEDGEAPYMAPRQRRIERCLLFDEEADWDECTKLP